MAKVRNSIDCPRNSPAAPEAHTARVLAQGDRRPMAGHPEALRDLELILEARSQHYERADVTVDTTDKRVEVSLAELRMALAAYGVTKARVRGRLLDCAARLYGLPPITGTLA